jgi:hypothetical protein
LDGVRLDSTQYGGEVEVDGILRRGLALKTRKRRLISRMIWTIG